MKQETEKREKNGLCAETIYWDIGNLGKVENGIVAVTAYGIFKGMTFPLLSEVYKPKSRLKEGDEYKSKPQIAGEIIKRLKKLGFKIKLVLADSE
jgi:SRSO17 transposase